MRKVLLALVAVCILAGCDPDPDNRTSDQKQQAQQEQMLREGTSQVGMPAIKNFRERKLMKDILEMRDQDGLVTYTYLYSEMTGKLVFLGESIGYGIPYATQFTNPQKIEKSYEGSQAAAYATLPQADPNGLFSPAAAEGTWVILRNPQTGKAQPIYVEPRVIVTPFKLAVQ